MRSFRRLLATFFVFALVVGLPSLASAQSTTILRGGQLFDATDTTLTDNPGIVVRAGKIVARGATNLDTTGARVVQLDADQVILPGLIDLHAHYAVDFFGAGRVEETEGYPLLYLANGATTFTAGEMQPEKMRRVRRAIERGERRGPRLLTSGPYFGKARPGWDTTRTPTSIHAEVDKWAARGVRHFKAKRMQAELLRVLIDQAHRHARRAGVRRHHRALQAAPRLLRRHNLGLRLLRHPRLRPLRRLAQRSAVFHALPATRPVGRRLSGADLPLPADL